MTAAEQQPEAAPDINFALLQDLRFKPHPHIRDIPFPAGVHIGWAEIADQAKAAHHLLDLAGIPNDKGYNGDLDARTYLATRKIHQLQGIHDRLRTWHSRETAEGGMVGDYCVECGSRWPCDTIRLLDGEEVP